MAALSYGKRMLKESLKSLPKRKTPKEEALSWVERGMDPPERFSLKYISDYKGFGVFATKNFRRGDFILEYRGSLIAKEDAEVLELKHARAGEGCFMFFFSFNGKQMCYDATETHDSMARFANDAGNASRNSKMQIVVHNSTPHLCLFATTDITAGDEVLYDYGDKNLPWKLKRKSLIDRFSFVQDDDSDSDPFEVNDSDSCSETSDSDFIQDEKTHLTMELQELRTGKDSDLDLDVEKIPDSDEYSEIYTATPLLPTGLGSALLEGELEERKSPEEFSDKVLKGVELEAEDVPETTLDEDMSNKVLKGVELESEDVTTLDEDMSNKVLKGVELEAEDVPETTLDEDMPNKVLKGVELESEDVTTLDEDMSNKVLKGVELEAEDVPETTLDEDMPNKVLKGVELESEDVTTLDEDMSNKVLKGVELEAEDVPETTLDEDMPNKVLKGVELEAGEMPGTTFDENMPNKGRESLMNDALGKESPVSKVRPIRFCIYCDKTVKGGKLKRHIMTHKNTEDEVKSILLEPKSVQNRFFEKKRIEGIFKYNTEQLAKQEDEHTLLRERKPKNEDSVRMCSGCHRFFSNRTFYRHKLACNENFPEAIKTETIGVIHPDSDFVNNILNRFRDTEVGTFIRSDETIQAIGYRHYCSRRVEISKQNEVRKEIMGEMRELARLFITFKELSDTPVAFTDMFTRLKLKTLREAIEKMCENEDNTEKIGLKQNLDAYLKKSIKYLKGMYSESMKDAAYKELSKFKKAYIYRSGELLANARYQSDKRSLQKARLPQNLPKEEDLRVLKEYTSSEVTKITLASDIKKYSWLRSLIVSRLTLFNARRGEEPSRMLLEEWNDAMSGRWLPKDQVEEVPDRALKYLVGTYKLAYLHGKGKKYVPVLIPKDMVGPINMLVRHREEFGISDENPFLFATKSSNAHCSGWHAVKFVSDEAGVKINATKNRHRASTIYSSLDMSPSDQKIFLQHLGHEEKINKDNYQCPPGIREVTVMGQFLKSIDGSTPAMKQKSTAEVDIQVEPVGDKKGNVIL
ncbi:uncharacterized protein LOC123565665 [Mercenaria mercenaria]|uniref:uncharacterized protein LOC123565665 n=1 Tax=Mercenaria mercenaria TaxID=6596 RepID=UPI00234EA9D5|nr:uncharacterized protein LOC123565665 [Mercenaria mercenaria]